MTHIIDSTMLYIHPPLAIIGYIFSISSLILILFEYKNRYFFDFTKKILYLAWLFNLAGLISGMLWAEISWGSYWSWDPKESITLILFISICFSSIFYDTEKKISLIMLVISCIMILINVIITFGDIGLHSYGF